MIKIGNRYWLCLFLMICGLAWNFAASAFAQNINQNAIAHVGDDASVSAPPDEMFVDVDVREHLIYLGETIRVEYDVFVAHGHGQIYYDALEPEFTNWYAAESEAPKASAVSFADKSYQKEPFATFFVTPTVIGKLPLPNLKVQVPFTDSKPWITHAERMVEVIPTPDPRPSHFYPFNVGHFTLESSLNKKQYRVGNPIVVEIKLTANAPNFGLKLAPWSLGNIADSFKVYPLQKDKFDEVVSPDGIQSYILFHIQILPLKPGEFTLPPFSIVTFDPASHQYITISTQPLNVIIEPSLIEPVIEPENAVLPMLENADIRDIHLRSVTPTPTWLIVFIIIPPVLLLLLFCYIVRSLNKQKYEQNKSRNDKILKYISTLKNADDAIVQLNTIRDLMLFVYDVRMGGTQSQMANQLSALFDRDDCKIILPVIHELVINSSSTHLPVSRDSILRILELILPEYVKRGIL